MSSGSFSYELVTGLTTRLILLSSPDERKPWYFLADEGESYIGQADTIITLYAQLRTLGRVSFDPEKLIAVPDQAGICDRLQARIEAKPDGHHFIYPGGLNYQSSVPTYLDGKKLLKGGILFHGSKISFQKPGSPSVELLFLDQRAVETSRVVSPDSNMAVLLMKQQHWLDAAGLFRATRLYEDAAKAFEIAAQEASTLEEKYSLYKQAADSWNACQDQDKENECLMKALECKGGPIIDAQIGSTDLRVNAHGSVDIQLRNRNPGLSKGWDALDMDVSVYGRVLKFVPHKDPPRKFPLYFGEEKRVRFSSVVFTEVASEILLFFSFRTPYEQERRFSQILRIPVIVREEPAPPITIGGDGIVITRHASKMSKMSSLADDFFKANCPHCEKVIVNVQCNNCGERWFDKRRPVVCPHCRKRLVMNRNSSD